ncbi:uncharacterized protein LOC130650073 isoform X1 [Hydractinia symbiolongicarpus]|uniref:uncharacterized protein LOC130650073 isoform X1 n=1 Tax=Hydractinia symbiolongicarpus TaxID=13093 RepID=UPI00254CCB81|nr:uncharacterized protein LOC130650073 isoform X1 [Hydractinia symbiolongicarpus]
MADAEKNEAVKFCFTFLIKKCVIYAASSWSSPSLQITWKRGERLKHFPLPFNERTEEVLTFEDLTPQSMFVTLHKNSGEFEGKVYTLQLEETAGLSLKRLATHSFNIADFALLESESELHCETKMIDLKPLSKMVRQVSLTVDISCEYLKTGFESDSDIESNFSHISDSDDETIWHTDVLQERAVQRRILMLEELKRADNATLTRFGSMPSSSALGVRNTRKDSTRETLEKLIVGEEVKEIVHQVCDDDFIVRKSLKIKRIELENEALRVRNAHLLAMLGTYKHDVEMMQAEISDLHSLVQNLRVKMNTNRADTKTTEPESIAQPQKLQGWLCKRGVKGGPLGRRWKKRWFAHHHDNCLYYYKKQDFHQQQGYIELSQVLGVQDVSAHKQDKNNATFNILTEERTYVLMAHDEQEKLRWINCLDELCRTVTSKESEHHDE